MEFYMQEVNIEVVLIDVDILRYELGSLTEKHPFLNHEVPLGANLVEVKVHERISGILASTGATKYETYFTGKGNWRYMHAKQTPYKGTRTQPKPANWQLVNDILMEHYTPTVSEGCEADDLLAIRHKELQSKGVVSCIASRDKDLDTVSGWRFRWKAGKYQEERLYYVDEFTALKSFYKQILTGDDIDNIDGCSYRRKQLGKSGDRKGVGYIRRYGIRKADELIEACTTEEEMYLTCLKQYTKKFSKREALPIMLENAQLLYMGCTGLNNLYQFPDFKG